MTMTTAGNHSETDDGTFVCVFNRDRDDYQVALALKESRLLEALVTDYYAPDTPSAWLPDFLRRKRTDGLPRSAVKTDRLAFVMQYLAQGLRLPMGNVWRVVGALLGKRASQVAATTHAGLYCYHHCLPDRLDPDTCLICFVFHPLPQHYLPALAADAERFPEAGTSFTEERNRTREFHPPIEWARMDALVCASQVTADTLVRGGAPPEKIAIIPYGAPEAATRTPDSRKGNRSPRVLFVGQGIQRKGLHHLIRAWQSEPRGDAVLTIASYALDPDIAALITDPSIEVLGYQEQDQLDALMAQSDVFAMPSLLEGFGLVYVEALAHGCHVLGTQMSGLPDLSLGAGAATLVPAGDLEQLCKALGDVIEKARCGAFDRAAIAAQASRWTQADFRRAIARHARSVLAARRGEGAYPAHFRAGPGR